MRHLGHVAGGPLILVLAACGGGQQPDARSAAFPPAPLPMYSAGDSYTFNDGSVDSVIAASDGAVQWRNASGARFETTRDVLLPPIAWADATMQGRRSFSAPPDALFPLRPDGGETLNADVTEQANSGGPATGDHEQWQCRVGSAQMLHTALGGFDTVRVDCAVTGMARGQYAERSFFYAPSIGYYVRRVDRIGDAPPRRADLVAWTDGNPPLPDSALQQRVAAIQRALENQASGTVVGWQDPATRISGSVEPVRTARGDDGRWCRDFQEHVAAFGRRYALSGEACRDTAGDWQVLDVAPFRAASR